MCWLNQEGRRGRGVGTNIWTSEATCYVPLDEDKEALVMRGEIYESHCSTLYIVVCKLDLAAMSFKGKIFLNHRTHV